MSQFNGEQNTVDLMAKNKVRPSGDPYYELTTFDLIPIEFVRIRRDKTSINGKMRNKYLNLSSNVIPIRILINEIEMKFRITRGFGIIKVNVSELLSNYDSGYHHLNVNLEHSTGTIHQSIKVDLRARKHYIMRKQGQFDHD